ncbi:MAG: beta-lactamase family protein [Lachnospiraceae bacterium]|nr:beta-lactamase family protein [Lachnospiraceae bacterium]
MHVLEVERLKRQIEATSLTDIQSGRVGGIAIAVMQNGETVYQNCFENEILGIHITEDTLFRLASMTKPVTAVAVLKLVEQGRIMLDDPVALYIPEFTHMNVGKRNGDEVNIVGPAKHQITIRHLLTHTSGLGSGEVGQWAASRFPFTERKSLEQNVQYYAKIPLDFEPFTKQAYSGSFAFDVLARIVELVADIPFGEYLKKEVLEPLDMTDTCFAPSKEQWERMIPMHDYKDGMGVLAEYPKDSVFMGVPTGCCSGGTALASTLRDYKKFADMLLNYGRYKGNYIIGEKVIREMVTAQVPEDIMSGVRNWGFGVRVVTADPRNVLPAGSFGWSGALGGHFWVDPTNQIVAIYLKNSLYDGGSGSKTGRQFEKDVYSAL